MTDTQRRFKFGVFCALVALLATVYPIRNATDRFNNAQVNADANEAASGSNDSQKLLSLGGLHSCAVTTSRGVKCWGQNDNGQLGDGTLTNSYLPKDVYVSGTSGTTLSNVLAISAGHRHTCALISGGTVKCWGDNAAGQLGDGTATDSKNPVSVLASAGTTLTGVVSISAGYSHTCVVMSDGTARCWGYNAWGQLGNGSALSSSYPVNVYVSGTSGSALSNVSAISAGWGHVCAVLTTGTAWCWGNNSSGQLGDGASTYRLNPVQVLGVGSDATLSGVSAISAGGAGGGDSHTCALLTNGGIRCWGKDNYGQLGNDASSADSNRPVVVDGFATSGAISISVGGQFACAVTTTGGGKCWGRSNWGQIGDRDTTYRPTPVSVNSGVSGTDLTGAGAINAGGSGSEQHACVLLSSGGSIKCWGNNQTGQVGQSTGSSHLWPMAVTGSSFGPPETTPPTYSSAAVNSSGTGIVLTYDETLSSTTATTSSFTVTVGGSSWPVNGVASSGTTVVLSVPLIRPNLSVTVEYVAPSSDSAPSNSAIQDSAGNDASSLTSRSITNSSAYGLISASDGSHTCAVVASGGVKCWGIGSYGRLGNGGTAGTFATSNPIAVTVSNISSGITQVSVGANHSCAVVSGGVKCWGGNADGQLGNGTTSNGNQTTPVDVVGLGSGSGVVQVVAGNNYTCAVISDGAAKCWGVNSSGQLGDGTTLSKSSPVDVSGLSNVSAVSIDQLHSCALLTSGLMKCWGQNSFGQGGRAGVSTSLTPQNVTVVTGAVRQIEVGSYHTCVVLIDGTVKCWGKNNDGQLGDDTNNSNASPVTALGLSGVEAVSLSDTSSCALLNTGAVKCWGNGAYGNIGNNNSVNSYQPLSVWTSSSDSTPLSSVSRVSVGSMHTCALISDGSVKCWGMWPANSVNYTTPFSITGLSGVGAPAPDVTAPTISAFSSTQATPTTATTFTYDLVFSESVTGVASVDFTNGGGATGCSFSVTGSGTNYTLTVSSCGDGTVQPVFAANGATDSAGNTGPSAVSSASTTVTKDSSSPTFVSASTSSDGSTITLTYSEALSATTASASAFSVVVGGSSRGVSSAVVSGSTVVLTLASAVGAGQSVTVAYTDPSGSNDANAVQDSLGTDATTLSATSVTNNVPQTTTTTSSTTTTLPTSTTSSSTSSSTSTSTLPSTTTTTLVAAVPTNGTTTSSSSTTTTSTIAGGPIAGTTTTTAIVTTTAPRRPRSTTTTAVNRTTTTVRATTTTTTTSLPAITTSSTTTTSSSSTTTTSLAPATITSVATGAIQTLQQAEEKLKTVEAQTSSATNDLRAAQIQVGESRVAVLDPKSALVVAVNVAEGRVASLRATKASNAEIAAAVAQLEDLKIAIAQNVTISIEKIATAQAKLAAVLSDPSASAKQVAEAKAELVSARVPTVEAVAAILNSVTTDAHLAPVIIPGVVDNAGSGQIVFLDGSIEKKVEIVRINSSAIRMTSTDGFTLNISTRDKDGQPLQFNSRGGIVVKHGNFISISGEGFAPGTLAKTWLFSSPRELGNLNVSTDGSFAADLPITDDIPVGLHVAQVDGLSPDGEVRSLSLDVEILPSEGPAEYDPIAKRLAVAALIAQAMALLALSRRREDNEGDDDREQADVSEVSIDQVVGSGDKKRDVYSPPVIRSIDGLLQQIPSRIASTQQLLARVIRDGVYLRALTGVGGVAVAFSGVIIGFFAANSSGFDAVSPSFGWLLALVILGSLDALAGGMAALTIIAVTAISGGIDSTDAIRGLLGLAVLSFAIPLVASTTRPFRRNSAKSENWLWTRTSDVVLLSLFGAWAAGAMYDALPGLYGFTSSAAGRTSTVQVVVLTTLIVRFMLEGVATKVTSNRLAYLAGPSLPEPSAGRSVFAIFIRTAIMLFVAEAFIGNNIALWIGAAMYAIPKLIALVAHRFPKSAKLKVWLPAGLLRTVVMLFVARWWASNISSFSEDPETQLQAAFVLLGIPSLVLTSLGWFAGGERKWRSTPISRVLGIVVLVIGVLTVRGVLFS